MNIAAFEWGRRAAFDLAATERSGRRSRPKGAEPSLEEIVDAARRLPDRLPERRAMLRATRRGWTRIAAAEERVAPGETALATEVAHSLFKLMAIKDEYEVARLLHRRLVRAAAPRGSSRVGTGWSSISPRRSSRVATAHGHLEKQKLRQLDVAAFRLLARLKFCAARSLDPFGRTRRAELGAAASRRLRSGARHDRGEALGRESRARSCARRLSAEDSRLRPCEGGAGAPCACGARAAAAGVPAGATLPSGGVVRSALEGTVQDRSQS